MGCLTSRWPLRCCRRTGTVHTMYPHYAEATPSGSPLPANGRLIQHNLFVTTQCRTQLRAEITELSDTVHTAFCAQFSALR